MIQNPEYLKEKFETGDVPTETDYADLIDSCKSVNESSPIFFYIYMEKSNIY